MSALPSIADIHQRARPLSAKNRHQRCAVTTQRKAGPTGVAGKDEEISIGIPYLGHAGPAMAPIMQLWTKRPPSQRFGSQERSSTPQRARNVLMDCVRNRKLKTPIGSL